MALLLGTVCTVLDSFYGVVSSMGYLFNNTDKYLFFLIPLLVWLNFFVLLTLVFITIASPKVPAGTAFIFVGFSMLIWARIFDNL